MTTPLVGAAPTERVWRGIDGADRSGGAKTASASATYPVSSSARASVSERSCPTGTRPRTRSSKTWVRAAISARRSAGARSRMRWSRRCMRRCAAPVPPSGAESARMRRLISHMRIIRSARVASSGDTDRDDPSAQRQSRRSCAGSSVTRHRDRPASREGSPPRSRCRSSTCMTARKPCRAHWTAPVMLTEARTLVPDGSGSRCASPIA